MSDFGAGAAVQMMGSIVSGYQQGQEAKSMANMAEYNERISLQEAKAIELKSAFDSQRQAEAADRVMSSLEAGLGGSGAVTTAGSPLLIKAKQASEFELENLFIGYEGRIGASQARSQAEIYRMQGKLYQQQARNRIMGGWLNAGATAMSTYSGGGGNNKSGTNNSNAWWNKPSNTSPSSNIRSSSNNSAKPSARQGSAVGRNWFF